MGLPRRAAWATAGGGGRRLRFVFYTDVHARTEWETPQAMSKAADAINAAKPDFCIAGGDLITDGFEYSAETVQPRWQAYVRMQDAIRSEVHPIIGNHDLVGAVPIDGSTPSRDPRAIFRETLGVRDTYRSFDEGGYHFILLDSTHVTDDDLKYHGYVWPEQVEWLKSDLERVPVGTPIIVVTHMPLLTAFFHAVDGTEAPPPKNRVIVNNREVLELFEGHDLALVLQGHLHVDELIRWRNTTFITGGAVCGKWWRGLWHGTEEGFGIVTLDGGRVEWEYIDYGWQSRRPKKE
jgi:3',5'-cyclic AMP phosphodiesterase CpdA